MKPYLDSIEQMADTLSMPGRRYGIKACEALCICYASGWPEEASSCNPAPRPRVGVAAAARCGDSAASESTPYGHTSSAMLLASNGRGSLGWVATQDI
jgi:hypothetical protein